MTCHIVSRTSKVQPQPINRIAIFKNLTGHTITSSHSYDRPSFINSTLSVMPVTKAATKLTISHMDDVKPSPMFNNSITSFVITASLPSKEQESMLTPALLLLISFYFCALFRPCTLSGTVASTYPHVPLSFFQSLECYFRSS